METALWLFLVSEVMIVLNFQYGVFGQSREIFKLVKM